MNPYIHIPSALGNPSNRANALEALQRALLDRWESEYRAATPGCSDLLTVTFTDPATPTAFIRTHFDVHWKDNTLDDRVVAVWGVSRREAASTRDKARMAGFLGGGNWSASYPGRDRGHFFAHTMGGGTDINLFPQLASVNRGGKWRQLENFAADNPGTFCFIRPIYGSRSWVPSKLEYGQFDLPPKPFKFRDGAVFSN